jgi:hypothetical protein
MQPYISLSDIAIETTEDDNGIVTLTTPGYDITTTIKREEDYPSEWALDWDRVGTIFTDSNKYSLGDEQGTMPEPTKVCPRCDGTYNDPERWIVWCYVINPNGRNTDKQIGAGSFDAMEFTHREFLRLHPEMVDGDNVFLETAPCLQCKGEGTVDCTIEEHIKTEEGAIAVLFIDIYDDWTPSLSIAAGEDGADGYIYTTHKRAVETLGDDYTIEHVMAAMKGEVEHYSNAMQGNVWRFDVEGADVRYGDSCGGFVGDDIDTSGAMYEAICNHKGEVSAAYKEKVERQYWLDRGVITIG